MIFEALITAKLVIWGTSLQMSADQNPRGLCCGNMANEPPHTSNHTQPSSKNRWSMYISTPDNAKHVSCGTPCELGPLFSGTANGPLKQVSLYY